MPLSHLSDYQACDSTGHRKRNVPLPIGVIRIDDNYRA